MSDRECGLHVLHFIKWVLLTCILSTNHIYSKLVNQLNSIAIKSITHKNIFPQQLIMSDTTEKPYKQYEVREGIIFLIELTESIFKPLVEIDNRSQLHEILMCVNSLISDMVVTFPKNGMGIYFYNSEVTASKFPKNSGITKIFSLNDLNSSNMKTLVNIVRDETDNLKPLTTRFKPCQEPLDNLHTVLRTILREFQYKTQYNRTKLLWFTANDRPYVNPKAKDGLRTMISDFDDNHIQIEPIFLDIYLDETQSKKKPFNTALYENIFLNTNFLSRLMMNTLTGNKEDENRTNGVLNKIKDSITRLKEVRRIQFSCDLVLSDGPGVGGALGCSIKGFTLFDHEKVKTSKPLYTGGDTLKVVYSDSSLVRSDTKTELETEAKHEEDDEQSKEATAKQTSIKGVSVKYTNDISLLKAEESNERVILLPDHLLQFMRGYAFDHVPLYYESTAENGEKSNVFSEESIDEVPFSKVPYLKLLCFRHMNKFQPYLNLKPALFVTADLDDGLGSGSREGGYSNSKLTFASLYQSCVKLQRYLMVFGCTKLNSTPTLYAMYPTNSQELDRSLTRLPDGFLLVTIPWLGEIRSLPDYILNEPDRYSFANVERCAPPEMVSAFSKVIELLGTKVYDPNEHSNPVLQYFYKVIKQEVLQIDIKDEDRAIESNDWSVKDLIEVRERFAEDQELKEVTQLIFSMLGAIGEVENLKRAGEGNESKSKRQKPQLLSEADIITLWKNDTWENSTVAQLKEFIKRYHTIPTATRKADMVSNIKSFLESRQRS